MSQHQAIKMMSLKLQSWEVMLTTGSVTLNELTPAHHCV